MVQESSLQERLMNSNSLVRFTRSCPTCGRRIQIRGSLLGHVVACRHCNAEFVATATDEVPGQVDDATRLMQRVESMLSRSQAAIVPADDAMISDAGKPPSIATPNTLR